MRHLDFLVQRKGIDPTAESCLHAARELMHVALSGVECGTLWRFTLDAPTDGDEDLKRSVERAACRAGRYVNVNRDRFTWLQGVPTDPHDAPRDTSIVDVWVRDGAGRDPLALDYFKACGVSGLRDVHRGTLYRLRLLEADAAMARAVAEELTVSRSRTRGLLMNPHIQTAEILHVTSAPKGESSR